MDRPFETSPAQPLDKAISSEAGPKNTPMNISTTRFTWVPSLAKIFDKIPTVPGTLKQLINTINQPSSNTPFINMGGLLKHVVTKGANLNEPLMCLARPLNQPNLGVSVAQPFNKVPVMCMAGPFKNPMTIGIGPPMHVGQLRPPNKHSVPVRHRVAIGCVSGMIATVMVHPLDVVKIRMQLYPKNRTNLQMLRRILECEGTRAMYAGLTAGLLRQATYTSTRLGVYLTLLEDYQKLHGGKLPPLSIRLQIAIVAGLAGAYAGTPSEVALIRMTAEGRMRRSACSPNCSLACKKVRKATNAISMLYRLFRREGVYEVFRGATPTLLRSLFVSITVVSTYGEIQTQLKKFDVKDGFPLHAYTAIFSSLITAVVSSPIDTLKTQYNANMGFGQEK